MPDCGYLLANDLQFNKITWLAQPLYKLDRQFLVVQSNNFTNRGSRLGIGLVAGSDKFPDSKGLWEFLVYDIEGYAAIANVNGTKNNAFSFLTYQYIDLLPDPVMFSMNKQFYLFFGHAAVLFLLGPDCVVQSMRSILVRAMKVASNRGAVTDRNSPRM